MSYVFWESDQWFSGTLCCRYVVVRFGKLRLPMFKGGFPVAADWHWALGFFREGEFEVLGAWLDEGEGTAQRIAADLHDRGLERANAVAADDALLEALAGMRPKVCRNSTAQLLESEILSAHIRRVVRWTEIAGQHLQAYMSRGAKRQGPFADQAAAADFVAQTFQRAARDLLEDRWERAGGKRSALFGQEAFVAYRPGVR